MPKIKDLKVGDRVEIHNSTLSGRPIVEGIATIKRIVSQDEERIYAQVEFENEPAKTYPRFIYGD